LKREGLQFLSIEQALSDYITLIEVRHAVGVAYRGQVSRSEGSAQPALAWLGLVIWGA
jgi:hypothetical protein